MRRESGLHGQLSWCTCIRIERLDECKLIWRELLLHCLAWLVSESISLLEICVKIDHGGDLMACYIVVGPRARSVVDRPRYTEDAFMHLQREINGNQAP